MLHHSIRVEDIVIGERHRALSEDAVARLATSMTELGLQQPISVRMVDEMEIDGELTAGVPILVAGAHRLAAAKFLGWSHIDCIEVADDELRAELWEIDENLMRAELSPAQQAQHLSRRKAIWEALRNPDNLSQFVGRGNVGFASETAVVAGVDTRTVQRDLARADALGPDLKLIAGTSLDKGVEMDALAKMSPAKRHELAARAHAGEQVSARPVINDKMVILNQANAIIAAWNRACPEARDMVREHIDQPVFDRSRAAG